MSLADAYDVGMTRMRHATRATCEELAGKIFDLFRGKGASIDLKLGFDDDVRRALIRSVPLLNMTYGQMVQQYKQIFSMVSAPLRGSPMALAALRAFEALPQMETMDLIEVKGLPGLRVEAILNGTAGDFDFFHKLGKEAGLVEVLKNTSTAFFSVLDLQPTLPNPPA